MPKQPDERFPIPQPQAFTEPVLDLLGGVARPRPLSGEEAIRRLNEMEARARAGDPESQAELARRLLTEAPNARKNRRALILLRHAAAAGSATGLHLLALLHLRGQGLSQDLTKGVELLESAAYRGSKAAQADLAHALLDGIGTSVNTAKALYWLRLAAAQGDEQSALKQRASCATVRAHPSIPKTNRLSTKALPYPRRIRTKQYSIRTIGKRKNISLRPPKQVSRKRSMSSLSCFGAER